MKMMIACDGSVYADRAINDLRRAGLPPDGEAFVVSVADVLIKDSFSGFETIAEAITSRRTVAAVKLLEEQAFEAFAETREFAHKAERRVRQLLPKWRVETIVLQGAPAAELLKKADERQPDLIVCGSQGRSAIGRFFLGSVSKRIAEKAICSVRVARGESERNGGEPIRIIAGAGTLSDAERVVKSIGKRVWAEGTKARLVAVDDGASPGRISAVYPDAKAIFAQAAEPLRAAGLDVSIEIESGHTKTVLLDAAEDWKADSIFVAASSDGATGLSETAAGLVTGADCTVEIVR